MANWEIILGSSVVAAIISALITLYNNNRKSTLKRITDERGKWRVALRQITYELEECCFNKEKTRLVLAKLRHMINPYGKFESDHTKDSFYFKDANIWEAIDSYNAFDRDRLNTLQLRIYMALKYDWERSKAEIKTNIALPFSLAFAAIGGLFFYLNIKGSTQPDLSVELITTCVYIISLTLYPLVATRFHIKWLNNIVIFATICFWFFSFRTLTMDTPTGALAFAFSIFSILAVFISETCYHQYKKTFIKAARIEYEKSICSITIVISNTTKE